MHNLPWHAVEFRHLAALAAIAREGSFRAAADRLGYVQSAISEQIAYLERSIGTSVLERRRGSTPVALTEAGELLLAHVEEILGSLAAAEADLQALQEGRRGRLRIGACESVAVRLVPMFLRRFGQELPDVQIELTSAAGKDLACAVEAGDVDVAFGVTPPPAGPFSSRDLLHDPYVLLAPAGWPLAAAGEAPTPAQLRDLPLIGLASDDRPALVEAELRAHGVEPRYAMRADANAAVEALVTAGVGAAIVPRLMADDADPTMVALSLDGILSPRVITLYWREGRRTAPALARFVEVALDGCEAMQAQASRPTLAAV